MLQILMLIFGYLALQKGEFKITNSRKVYEPHGRIIGSFLFFGGLTGCAATVDIMPIMGSLIMIITFFASLVMGAVVSKPMYRVPERKQKEKLQDY